MKLLSSKEVGEILGISAVRVTQILVPDARKVSFTGGTPRCLYKMSTVQAEIARRATHQAEVDARRIEKDIKKAGGRPGPNYLTLTEAKNFIGRSGAVIRHNAKCRWVSGVPFFLPADLLAISPNAKARPKGKTPLKVCPICGKLYRSAMEELCKSCLSGTSDEADPYGTIRPQKKGTRKCPGGCGRTMLVGQYCCNDPSCVANLNREVTPKSYLDMEEAYGGLA